VSRLVKPGGLLVYSVCSAEREEGEDIVEGFLAATPAFKTFPLPVWTSPFSEGPFLRTLPERDRGDGFFVAALDRAKAPL
jgi:16S rRNA (cytosine967-C5)-methyltransferase